MNTLRLDPKIYEYVKKDISNGKNLKQILEENKNSEFEREIIAHYYHCNNGPDLRNYQEDIINYLESYYKDNDIYKLFWCCGLGKTKTSLTIAKRLDFKKILIFVPSIVLVKQFENELELLFLKNKIFVNDSEHINDKNAIINYLQSKNRTKIMLSTYHSSEKILEIVNEIEFEFDFIIYDESHHLLNKKSRKFIHSLKIPVKKRLYLTATPYLKEETKNSYSMSESLYFKGESNVKNIEWGISNNFVTDYKLIVCNIDINDIKIDLIKKYDNTQLIIAGYMCYKALINDLSNKILLYANTVNNSKIVENIIKDIIKIENPKIKIYVDELNGTNSKIERELSLKKFSNSKKGVLCSVQLFGEGYDCPELDSVVFAEKMESDIRIIQSGMRCCRLDPNNPNKIGKILLPISDDNESNLKQVLLKIKKYDNIINKVSTYNPGQPKLSPDPPSPNPDPSLNIELDETIHNNIINKINLTYLKEEIINQTIITNNELNFNEDNVIILLSPISEKSFNNFYNSVLSQNYKDKCYWGFKEGNYKNIYEKLRMNDIIIFIETNYITICNIICKQISENIAETYWKDKRYKYNVKMKLIKRVKLDKKTFLTKLGYKETDNLMGSRIFNFKKYNTKYLFNILYNYGETEKVKSNNTDDKKKTINNKKEIRLTSENSKKYIGYNIKFKYKGKEYIKKLEKVSNSGNNLTIDLPEINNRLGIGTRRKVVVIV